MTYANGGIVPSAGGPHDDRIPPMIGCHYVMGGRLTTSPGSHPDEVMVEITGGRHARRTGTHTAALVCGECHQVADIERRDGQPLSDPDITEALANFAHDCTRPAG